MASRKHQAITARERKAVLPTVDPSYEPCNPAEPTKAMPGTEEKITVMCHRVQHGQPLFVPGDGIHEHEMHEPAGWTRGFFGVRRTSYGLDRDEVY